jgi:hypothetical protein
VIEVQLLKEAVIITEDLAVAVLPERVIDEVITVEVAVMAEPIEVVMIMVDLTVVAVIMAEAIGDTVVEEILEEDLMEVAKIAIEMKVVAQVDSAEEVEEISVVVVEEDVVAISEEEVVVLDAEAEVLDIWVNLIQLEHCFIIQHLPIQL